MTRAARPWISCEKTPESERSAARAASAEPAADQVRDRLRLHEVELVVVVGALGELARPREPRAELERARDEQVHDDRAAVAVQLEHVLAREGIRRGKVDREPDVDRLAGAIREHGDRRMSRRRQLPQHAGPDRARLGAGDADDPDAAAAGRRRARDDRVGDGAHGPACARTARPSRPGCGCVMTNVGMAESQAEYGALSSKARRNAAASKRAPQRGRIPPAR